MKKGPNNIILFNNSLNIDVRNISRSYLQIFSRSNTYLIVKVMALYVTGDMNVVLSPAHQMEIKRYTYNHQVLFYI